LLSDDIKLGMSPDGLLPDGIKLVMSLDGMMLDTLSDWPKLGTDPLERPHYKATWCQEKRVKAWEKGCFERW